MKRRNFIKTGAILSTMPTINSFAFPKSDFIQSDIQTVKPKRLQKGDTIGLVTPGSSIDKDELNESIENLEKLGFNIYHTDSIFEKNGYLAGTDKQRADDINHMFENENVDGIVCARGGYGCNRILQMIDYELIKQNPKVLVGYSDITALLYAIYSQTGLVTFHGPVGISTFNEYSINYLEKILMSEYTLLDLIPSEKNKEKDDAVYKIYTINDGIAEGELIGGNLSIVASLLGTPYDVDYKGKIIFLEDIGEEPYRIDRMLTELILADKLQQSAGIALGVFIDCEVDEDKPSYKESFTLKEVFYDRLSSLGVPVIYGLSFGHISNKYTVPFGIKARLDTNKELLTLTESCIE